jgi:glutamate racemase
MENRAPIGIFDSGVGGLSVLREIRKQLPRERLIFLADQAHVPYGPRPLEQVRDFAEGITRYLLSQDAKLVVVACNAASAAALHHLRRIFPQVPFVGMEPAVKPAVEHTHSGIVGVLATPATFQGALYASVLERFAQGVIVLQDTCPGLVAQIEAGELDTPATRQILDRALQPMLAQGIDTVVLGCTHYPFVIPLIEEIVGEAVRVIDPAPAVARQVARVLVSDTITTRDQIPVSVRYLTTSESSHLQVLLEELIGETSQVEKLVWRDNQLELSQI